MADPEKADAGSKASPNGRGKKRAIAADKRVAALEAEHSEMKAAHVPLADISAQSKVDAKKA